MVNYRLVPNPDGSPEFIEFIPTEKQLKTLEEGTGFLQREGYWLRRDDRPHSFELGNVHLTAYERGVLGADRFDSVGLHRTMGRVIALRRGVGPESEIREIIPQIYTNSGQDSENVLLLNRAGVDVERYVGGPRIELIK